LAKSNQHQLGPGTPDSVRCPRLVKRQLAALGKRERRHGYNSPDCLSGEAPDCPVSQRRSRPTVGCAIRGRRVASSNGRLGTPDCPVRQPIPRTNGRLRPTWKEIAHRTATVVVWWCTGLSSAPLDRRQKMPSKLISNGS
jgi:hypothetical protein